MHVADLLRAAAAAMVGHFSTSNLCCAPLLSARWPTCRMLPLPQFTPFQPLLRPLLSSAAPPPACQVADLLRAAAAKPLHLRTSLGPLDAALLGGLPAGSVNEVRHCLICLLACLLSRLRPPLLCWAGCPPAA